MERAVARGAVVVVLAGAAGVAAFASIGVSVRPPHRAERAVGAERAAVLVRDVREKIVGGDYRRVDRSRLPATTVQAVIAALGDPYTRYLTPAEYTSLRNRTARTYSGIGLT